MSLNDLMALVPELTENLLEKKESKKRKNSKSKGNRGELKICSILTEHFGLPFNRVPNSGAFGTTHSLNKNAQEVLSGDLITPPNFKFSIENKIGYDIDIIDLFMAKTSSKVNSFYGFVQQSINDAVRSERLPMVIYSKDYKDPILVIPNNLIKENDFQFKLVFKKKFMLSDCEEWAIISLKEALAVLNKSFWFNG